VHGVLRRWTGEREAAVAMDHGWAAPGFVFLEELGCLAIGRQSNRRGIHTPGPNTLTSQKEIPYWVARCRLVMRSHLAGWAGKVVV
jgi:hypothetical protein